MRYLFFLSLVTSCLTVSPIKLEKGECVLGENMVVWKLVRAEQGLYLFVDAPEEEGSLVRTVKDISVFKKVECPK